MKGFTAEEEDYDYPERFASHWVRRFGAVLDMKLPFNKVGIAHLTCNCLAPGGRYLDILQMIPDEEMAYLFAKAAKLGAGIELNFEDMKFSDDEADIVLRPYRIAKKCGCKFYFGSDAHKPEVFEKVSGVFERAVDLLGLTEEDKFTF
jgi:hypothetical protein